MYGSRGGYGNEAMEESPDVEAVRQACEALPADTGGKLKAMFSCNGLQMSDLDVKSVMELARLHITLQQKVLQHLESERVFLCNSRSKSRFLISTCEGAKQGRLDVRGFGAIDPWKSHLNAIAVQSLKPLEFVSEEEYIAEVGENAVVCFEVDVSICPTLTEENENSPVLCLWMPISSTPLDLRDKISLMGCSVPLFQMKLKVLDSHPGINKFTSENVLSEIGFFRLDLTFGYYNLPVSTGGDAEAQNGGDAASSSNGVDAGVGAKKRVIRVQLVKKQRGGMKRRRDLSLCTAHPQTRKPLVAQMNAMPAMPAMPATAGHMGGMGGQMHHMMGGMMGGMGGMMGAPGAAAMAAGAMKMYPMMNPMMMAQMMHAHGKGK